uniref:Uncharacterized protein n=1 Tax=Vespula pensylvanica TaxID=30213 RepID=A0A834U7K4_VESPE|nr:hypothetical protein H0235_010304 [Vespula pensylvanica]
MFFRKHEDSWVGSYKEKFSRRTINDTSLFGFAWYMSLVTISHFIPADRRREREGEPSLEPKVKIPNRPGTIEYLLEELFHAKPYLPFIESQERGRLAILHPPQMHLSSNIFNEFTTSSSIF